MFSAKLRLDFQLKLTYSDNTGNMHFTSSYIEDIIGFASMLGTSAGRFDRELATVNLEKASVDYDTVVTFLTLAVKSTDDDCFGLHMGEYYALKATQSVDGIMERSLTVKDAFKNAVAYSKLISDSMDCELVEKHGSFSVTFTNNPDWHLQPELAKRHNLDTALVSAVKALVFLTGHKYYPSNLHLPYPRVKQINEYFRVFNCSLNFNCEVAEIEFDKSLLDEKVNTHDVGLLQKLTANARKQLQTIGSGDELIKSIKRAILKHLKGTSYPSLDEVSAHFNMSSRTLQRRLSAKNLTYSSILVDVKLNLALKHLKEDGLKVEEVAYLAGYSESSALVRAFKQWKGKPPKAYLK